MRIYWLEGPEAADRLNPICEQQGWSLLNPHTCRACIAEDDDGVFLRALVVQLFPLVGPEYAPERERGNIEAMMAVHAEVRNYMADARGFMIIADSPVTDKLCKREGLTPVTSPVYMGPVAKVVQ